MDVDHAFEEVKKKAYRLLSYRPRSTRELRTTLLEKGFAADIASRFGPDNRLFYKVYYNGIPVGKIEWEYKGRGKVAGKLADVLYLNSDTKILQFFNLKGDERVFLDANSHLPLKVERDIYVFGKKEIIEEIYNQKTGQVKIIKTNSRQNEEEIINQDAPVHNILSLLYFFPQGVDLQTPGRVEFNLPTQIVGIKKYPPRRLKINGEHKECYFLVGKGKQKFRLWLDKETRVPFRVEFILPIGKVSIVRKDTL